VLEVQSSYVTSPDIDSADVEVALRRDPSQRPLDAQLVGIGAEERVPTLLVRTREQKSPAYARRDSESISAVSLPAAQRRSSPKSTRTAPSRR